LSHGAFLTEPTWNIRTYLLTYTPRSHRRTYIYSIRRRRPDKIGVGLWFHTRRRCRSLDSAWKLRQQGGRMNC